MTSHMLSDQQRLVLTALCSYQGMATPQRLAIEVDRLALSWYGRDPHTAWQGLTRTMASLVRRGFATRHSLPKMTWYEITDTGRQACRP